MKTTLPLLLITNTATAFESKEPIRHGRSLMSQWGGWFGGNKAAPTDPELNKQSLNHGAGLAIRLQVIQATTKRSSMMKPGSLYLKKNMARKYCSGGWCHFWQRS